jgi:hypothetical protein
MKKIPLVMIGLAVWSGVAFGLDLNPNSWTSSSETDPFTDETKTFAVVAAEGGPKEGLIAFGCYSGKSFEGKISAGKYIGDKDLYTDNVKYRIDKLDPVSTSMKSDDSVVYFNDMHEPLVEALMSGQSQVVVQLTSYDYDTSIAKFTLKGSTAAISKVLQACK